MSKQLCMCTSHEACIFSLAVPVYFLQTCPCTFCERYGDGERETMCIFHGNEAFACAQFCTRLLLPISRSHSLLEIAMAKSSAEAKELLKFIAQVSALAGNDEADGAATEPLSRGEHAKLLQACADAYLQSHSFRAGDFVQLKPALAGAYIYPRAGYPAVVVEDIDPPLVNDDKESHCANYGLELDLRILVIADDGTPVTFAVPGQVFEPYVEQPAANLPAQEGVHDQTSAG